jgi:hypothetical protein
MFPEPIGQSITGTRALNYYLIRIMKITEKISTLAGQDGNWS